MSIDPSSLRADARRNYDRLLRTAEKVFAAQHSATSLDAIAKQAGVGIGTLYRHFPTRKALLEAVYADKLAALVAQAQSLLERSAPDKALIAWLETTLDYANRYNGFAALVNLETEDATSRMMTAGSHLLEQAQHSGSLRKDITIREILRLINGIVDTSHPEDVAQTRRLLSVIVSGLKPTDDQPRKD